MRLGRQAIMNRQHVLLAGRECDDAIHFVILTVAYADDADGFRGLQAALKLCRYDAKIKRSNSSISGLKFFDVAAESV
jgi:hypothetical protein